MNAVSSKKGPVIYIKKSQSFLSFDVAILKGINLFFREHQIFSLGLV